MKKYLCEFIGTTVLVLFGCGTAAITNANSLLTAFAFGLSIIAMAYVIGNISGCHLNPAVSLAMLINKKMSTKDFIGYVIAQFIGGFAGIGLLYALLSCTGYPLSLFGFGANGFDEASAFQINMLGAIIIEVILTFVFVYTVLGVTSDEKKSSVSGLVIGLTLTFVHILGIPFTGTSVNPARSLAPAVFSQIFIDSSEALSQVWVFILAPLVGATIAAFVYKFLNKKEA